MSYENLNLEKFSGYGSKISRKISITKSFSFGLPPAFFQENSLNGYTKVAIFYDKKERVIALHFNNEEGFKLSTYGEGTKQGASFLARSFFTTYDLKPADCKGRYTPEKIHKDGIGDLFVIKLAPKKEAA
jgi:hypothetical protein